MTLCDPTDCSLPGSIIYGIFQARILEWFRSVQFSHSVVFNYLQPHKSQHTRPPCPSPTPRVYSNPCPSNHLILCCPLLLLLLIARFRLKLKKVGKTTRPFKYDLNQIPYDYTVEVRNRFKGLDPIDKRA